MKQIMNMRKPSYDFDNESVDTYRMEMGDDYEMPSIRTNQKLRHTFFNNKNSWDTMTHKAYPTKVPIDEISESAGDKEFKKMLEEYKQLKEEKRVKDSLFDSKTVQDRGRGKGKSWQNSTTKSTLTSNIQDKVQQALTKTKSVMQMLKRTKSLTINQ